MGEANRRQFLKGAIGIGAPTWAKTTDFSAADQQLFNIPADALYVWEPDGTGKMVSEALRLLEANRVFYSFPDNQDALSEFLGQGFTGQTHGLLSAVTLSGAVTNHQPHITEMRRMDGVRGVHLNHESGARDKDEWLDKYLSYLDDIETGNLEVSITLDWKWYDTAVEGTTDSTVERAKTVREHDAVDWVVVMPYHVEPSVVVDRIEKSMGGTQRGTFSGKPFLFAVETQNPRTNDIHKNATVYGKRHTQMREYLSGIRRGIPSALRRNLIGKHVAVHDFRALVNQTQTFPRINP